MATIIAKIFIAILYAVITCIIVFENKEANENDRKDHYFIWGFLGIALLLALIFF